MNEINIDLEYSDNESDRNWSKSINKIINSYDNIPRYEETLINHECPNCGSIVRLGVNCEFCLTELDDYGK